MLMDHHWESLNRPMVYVISITLMETLNTVRGSGSTSQ